jgi:hypothetical protein
MGEINCQALTDLATGTCFPVHTLKPAAIVAMAPLLIFLWAASFRPLNVRDTPPITALNRFLNREGCLRAADSHEPLPSL